jgi:hypothetical protein
MNDQELKKMVIYLDEQFEILNKMELKCCKEYQQTGSTEMINKVEYQTGFYWGLLKSIDVMGYNWERTNGKHKIYK